MREEKAVSARKISLPASSNWLNECLVDGDEAARRGSLRARKRALFVSVGVQVLLLSALVIGPLFAVVPRPDWRSVVPVPPYRRGVTDVQPSATTQRPSVSRDSRGPTFSTTILAPGRVPPRIGTSEHLPPDSSGPPGMGAGTGPGIPDGVDGGLEIVDPRRQPQPMPPTEPDKRNVTRPMRVSEGVEQAMLIRRVEPNYPQLAKMAHIEGTVRLHAIIGKDGVVRDLEILSGHALLAQAARDAVLQWRYRPTILNGEPVEVDTYVTVVFTMGH